MYLNGIGTRRDYAKAEYWLGKAADQGDRDAQFLLGKMYRDGHGVERDLERGRNWLERAGAQGHSEALKLLAFFVELGLDSLEVYRQRGDVLQQRAAGGDVEAQYQLGLRYESGAWGAEQDSAKALCWLNKAAEAGHRGAMTSLAHIYRDGLFGVAPDPKAAAYWEQRAKH